MIPEGEDGAERVPVAAPGEQSGSPRGTIDALTGLRILAAVWVVLYHFRSTGVLPQLLPASQRLAWFTGAGFLGVDLFFTLSGFVIAYNYLDGFQRLGRRDCGRFLYLRLARIYPLHLATLVALLITVVTARAAHIEMSDASAFGVRNFVANVLLVQAWGGKGTSWNYPAWSISAEWFAYLLFPFIAWTCARLGFTTSRRALGGVLVTLAVGLPLLGVTGDGGPIPLVRVTVEFLAGCFLFVLYRHTRRRGDLFARVLPLSCVLVVVLTWVSGARTLVVAPALILVVWSASQASGAFAAWLASRSMVFAGQLSFALYMTHALVFLVLKHVLAPADFAGASLGVRLAVVATYSVSIGLAAVLAYMLVERPSREWMRRRLPRSGSPSVAP